MSRIVIPDTNVLVHFQSFDSVPWARVAGAERVEVILLGVVVRELDMLKLDAKRATRAREVLRKISSVLSEGNTGTLSTGMRVSFVDRPCSPEYLSGLGLSPSVVDHQIIGACLSLVAEGSDVLLVSDDTGAKLNARAVKLPVVGLSDPLI